MNHKQHILEAIGHRRPDRTPRGDLAIGSGLLHHEHVITEGSSHIYRAVNIGIPSA